MIFTIALGLIAGLYLACLLSKFLKVSFGNNQWSWPLIIFNIIIDVAMSLCGISWGYQGAIYLEDMTTVERFEYELSLRRANIKAITVEPVLNRDFQGFLVSDGDINHPGEKFFIPARYTTIKTGDSLALYLRGQKAISTDRISFPYGRIE